MKLKGVFRALFAIVVTSVLLLLIDLDNRKPDSETIISIAIFKIASRPVLDDSETGVIQSLKDKGFEDKKNCNIRKFCAEGDMAVANMIAQNILSSKFDMVITISTPALQVMANTNKKGQMQHVFCTVTDPYASGVGITGPEPDQHPQHLVGIGTFQPVEATFELAKQMKPDLKKVGTVWCTSETCSEACVRLARKKCAALGIELVEVSVENTSQIFEAATSLTMRGIEAIWLGGDNVVELGIDQLINACARAKIPLFTNNPYKVTGNTLFALGASYYDVGYLAGEMAASLLNGKPTDQIGVKDFVPQKLVINEEALKNIKDKWEIEKIPVR